ncbi:hypothetical protein [Methylomagnum sp.]
MPTSKLTPIIALSAALLFGAAPAFAVPSMYWDHIDGGTMSQADCVSKAEAILTKENAGKLTKDEDSVRTWNEKTTGVVECLKADGKLMIMVLAGSDDANAANAVFTALMKGLKP